MLFPPTAKGPVELDSTGASDGARCRAEQRPGHDRLGILGVGAIGVTLEVGLPGVGDDGNIPRHREYTDDSSQEFTEKQAQRQMWPSLG